MSAVSPPGTLSPLRSALRRLSGYVGRNRALYAIWLLTTLAYVALLTGFPILVGRSIDLVAEGASADALLPWAGLLIGVAVVGATLRFFTRVLVFNAAREIEYEMRNDLFAHLTRLPQSFYGRWRTGDIMSRCVNDLTAVRTLLGFGLLQVVQTPIFYVAVLGTMFALDAKLALFVLIPYPLFILMARTLGRSIYRWSLAAQEGLGELSNQLQETISGISVVKAYAMEAVTAERFETANQSLYRRQLQLVRSNAALSSLVLMLPAAAMWIILWLGGRQILADRMNVGDFFTFAMFVYELTFPTLLMGWVVALTQRGAAAMQRIDELLSIEPAIADRPDAAAQPSLRGEIEFRGLEFRYPDASRPALSGIDLRVPAGTTLGVVGPVGSGKTTLASLIPRIHPVADGQLFVDGIDVNRIALRTLRSAIAVVPQESFLFSMSLSDNIAFGVEAAGSAAIREAAQRAQLAKDVEELPDGYDTVVGERGVMLSGGQRQRAALARALMLEPSILILDDTLSAVDAETEAEIRGELREVFRGRTVVLISSRVSAVRDADQIAVLDAGRIVELGSHESLLAEAGLYFRLAREQARERDLTRALEAVGDAP